MNVTRRFVPIHKCMHTTYQNFNIWGRIEDLVSLPWICWHNVGCRTWNFGKIFHSSSMCWSRTGLWVLFSCNRSASHYSLAKFFWKASASVAFVVTFMWSFISNWHVWKVLGSCWLGLFISRNESRKVSHEHEMGSNSLTKIKKSTSWR